jgi:hypothetical protein
MSLRFPTMLRLSFLFVSAAALASPASAQLVGGVWGDAGLFEGSAADQHFGFSVAGGGDYDGDGIGDWLVGSHKAVLPGSEQNGRIDVISGADGSVLASAFGSRWDRLGISADWIGYVDGDGKDDFVAGGWLGSNKNTGVTLAGRAYVWSSVAGAPLRTHFGTVSAERFGGDVAGGMDVDLDGVNDYLVGARNAVVNGVAVGSVFCYSGATGAELMRIDGAGSYEYFGAAVDFAGDVDGDGYPDILVGSAEANGGAGFASVYSGATGVQLLQVVGNGAEQLGGDVAGIGDVDGDGFADLLVGAPNANGVGAAYVFSGFSGALLHQFDGAAGTTMGFGLANAGDVDGDGVDELLVGAPGATSADTGFARLYNSSTGALVREFATGVAGDAFGRSGAGLGDLDGDGCAEFVIGAHKADSAGGKVGAGSAYLYTFDPIFFTDVTEMGAVAGGQVDCQFDFPDTEAGMNYAILLSYSGIGPTNYSGIDIPLTQDPMFDRTVNADWPRIFTAPHGVLDANGAGSTIYIGDALWLTPRVGETFRGCVVSYDTNGARLVSVPRPLTILP